MNYDAFIVAFSRVAFYGGSIMVGGAVAFLFLSPVLVWWLT